MQNWCTWQRAANYEVQTLITVIAIHARNLSGASLEIFTSILCYRVHKIYHLVNIHEPRFHTFLKLWKTP